MQSEHKKAEAEALQKHQMAAKRSDWAKDAMKNQKSDGFYTCKCGSKKTSYYQQQTRGADEPMTVFIECLDCHNKWKM